MLLKKIKILNLFGLLMVIGLGLFGLLRATKVDAQTSAEACAPIEMTVIARDAHGNFIPNISFQVFRQVNDVDGNPKPEKQVSSGVIDSNLGKKTVKFTDSNGVFVLKMWSINKTSSHFYFYNIGASCGQKVSVEKVLSSIKIVLRDTDQELRKNTQVSLYTQRYDVNHDPIKEKEDLIVVLDTSAEGSALAYVPDRSSTINGEGTDYYYMEVMGKDGIMFTDYDVYVPNGREKAINFVFNKLELKLKDSKKSNFPANENIEIFKQKLDENDDYILGDKQKDIITDDTGTAVLEIPEGIYAARVIGVDKKYQYFWDLDVDKNKKNSYELITDEVWVPEVGACEEKSSLSIITRDIQGTSIPKLKVEIFEQTEDVDKEPKAGVKVISTLIDDYGKASISFNPDPRKNYAVKIYESNPNVGEFWFYDAIKLQCGENKEITKNLPAIHFVLRDGSGALYKNQKFSLYTQKLDVDGKPIKEKSNLVGSNFITSEKGEKTVYLAPDHPYDNDKKGTYIFESARNEGGEMFREYGITVSPEKDLDFQYVFSDLVLDIKNAGDRILAEKQVDIYEQLRALNGGYELGKLLKSKKTDKNGLLRIEYPAGNYAVSIKDDLGQKIVFWNVQIKTRVHNEKELVLNLLKIKASSVKTGTKNKGASVRIFTMADSGNGEFYADKKIKEIPIRESGLAQMSLQPGAYLFASVSGKTEYGQTLFVENGKIYNITLDMNEDRVILPGQKFKINKPASAVSLADKLSGKILLQVEERGEAWYVDTKTKLRYYMKDGASAYALMRKFGLGITNADLNKISVGIDQRFEEYDYDGDLISDKMEDALGTDMYLSDSDNDGHEDGKEIVSGYNPLGAGKTALDSKFADKLKGRILLQTESRGESWYVNPSNAKRYYMQDGESAYEMMKFLSLGVKNSDLEQIGIGHIIE
jgi:hypothetical protein